MRTGARRLGQLMLAGWELRGERRDRSTRRGAVPDLRQTWLAAPQPDRVAFRAWAARDEAFLGALRGHSLVHQGHLLHLQPRRGPRPPEVPGEEALQRAESRRAFRTSTREESGRSLAHPEREGKSRREDDSSLPVP